MVPFNWTANPDFRRNFHPDMPAIAAFAPQ